MIYGQINGPGTAVVIAPFFYGLSDGGIINNGKQFFQMFCQNFEIQHFISVMKLVEKDIFFQIFFISIQLLPGSGRLLFQCFHSRRETSCQS